MQTCQVSMCRKVQEKLKKDSLIMIWNEYNRYNICCMDYMERKMRKDENMLIIYNICRVRRKHRNGENEIQNNVYLFFFQGRC